MKTRDLENTLNKVQDTKSLSQYIQTIQNTSYDAFHEYFNQLIQEKNLNRSEIIEHSGIERTYCYHILNGTKNPSRDKILCLCIAAGCNLEETRRALEISRQGILYAKNTRDTYIQYAINQHLSLIDTNILLSKHHETILE